jgi:hypothetical protein
MRTDTAGGDLHLLPVSPCIGTSMLAAGVATDIDGQPRSAGIDIGADEFSSATIGTVGSGCAGTGGVAPRLGWLSWPFLGNPDFALLASDLPPTAPMFTFVAYGAPGNTYPVGFGCSAHLHLGSLVALPVISFAGPAGTASIVIAWPANAAFIGVNYGFQGMVVDAGAPLGLTVTNAIDLVLAF